ncbi:MAG TPA: hypothetical protein VM012_03825 [Flavitalea sp.]|nr:hypothetical protein [Flavitalea sp.]
MSIAAQESSGLYSEYVKRMQKIADIRYASALLQWDQETYMPAAGAPFRGQQIATLTESAHEFFTSEITGNILEELKNRGDLTEIQQRNISLSWEDYSKQKKYDSVLYERWQKPSIKVFISGLKRENKMIFQFFYHSYRNLLY